MSPIVCHVTSRRASILACATCARLHQTRPRATMISSFIKTIFKFATSTAIVAITLALQRYFISPRLDSDRPKRPFHEPPDFDQCSRLQVLLTQIQHHILESIPTQQRYAAICEDIKHELQDGTLSVN